MSNKYYTPTIDEFHVGFEFELKNSSDEPFELEHAVVKNSYRVVTGGIYENDYDHLLSNIEYDIKEGFVRVKYLDKEDIESLGFITRLEPNINKLGYSKDNSFLFKKDLKFSLFPHHEELNKIFIIYKGHNIRSIIYLSRSRYLGKDDNKIIPEIQLFNGYIKNKSELVKILKQLGIDVSV